MVARLPWYVVVPALLAGAATLLPVVYLAIRAFAIEPGVLLELLLRPRTGRLLTNTFSLMALVLLGTTILALPLAWLTVRTDIKFGRLITWLAVTPLAIPGYVMAYTLLGLGGYQGLLSQLFDVLVARPSGLLGAAAALTLYTFPYLFLNVRSALLGLDASLEESGRSLGLGQWTVARRIVLPQLRPALLAGWLIVALYVLGDFGAVALMRFETFSFAIYTQYTSAFDRSYAACLALVLLLFTVALVIAEVRLLGSRRYARVGSGAARSSPPARLGWYAPLAYLFVVLALGAAVALPAVTLAAWMILAPPDVRQLGAVLATFARTASVAVPAALIATLFALPVAILSIRARNRGGWVIERLVHVGYAIPPIALALAFVMFSIRSAPGLYQTPALLVTAYVVSFLALAIGPIRTGLMQISPRLEETARSLGRSRSRAFLQTTLPLMTRNLLASAALVLMVVMKELPMTYLLAPTGFTTLAVRVFGYTSEGMMPQAAPFAAAVVLFSSLVVGLLLAYEGRRR